MASLPPFNLLQLVQTLPTTAPSAGGLWLNNGVLTLAGPTSSPSAPGGGPNNTADHSDPNNAYLAAMAA